MSRSSDKGLARVTTISIIIFILIAAVGGGVWWYGTQVPVPSPSTSLMSSPIPKTTKLMFSENPALIEARERMVEKDLRGRDITDEKILEAMKKVPRHMFVDESLKDVAYADHPLPIGEGQTISQPYVVALMTQSLGLNGSERILEIGTGSGYQAAILAELVAEVYTVEIRETLAIDAERRLKDLGYENVHVKHADGYFGWEEHAPFDAIIVTAAVNHIPPYLTEQLKEGGRLILPLGSTSYYQTLTLIHKHDNKLDAIHVTTVRFVPMVGEASKES